MSNDEINDTKDLERISEEEQSVETPDGKTVRLADVIDIVGGDRTKAYGVLWLASIGASAGTAAAVVSTMSARQARAQASTGSGSYSVNEIVANLLDTSEVQADTLSGSVVGRTEPVDYIAGNWHNDSSRPSNPEDNDVLFYRGGSS